MGRIRVALLSCLALVLLTVVPVADAQAPEPRVVGGHAASIEQYPWQVAVVGSPNDFPSGWDAFDRQFCGGVLVTSRIVLTAAHCLYDTDFDCDNAGDGLELCDGDENPSGDGTTRPEHNDIDVVLGRTTLSNSSAGVELELFEDSEAISISEDPDFNPGTFQNDVGYLVLETPPALGASIAPIDIAGNDEAALWDEDGDLQDVSGWGSTEFSGGEDTLRAASVPIVSDGTCGAPAIYGTDFDPATMVCAGFLAGGVDTCQGDSGGPLEAPLEGGGYRLIGLTSWGDGCAEPNAPGVYTRIAEAGPGGLRDEVVTKVDELEAFFALPDEEIVGNGGQPRTTPFAPPAPEGGGQVAGATTVSTPRANDPYLKCHKIFNKKKRRKCFRRVRASL
jgi:trypsin